MIPGAPRQARSIRSEPPRSLPAPDLSRLIPSAVGPSSVFPVEPLSEGVRNQKFNIQLDSRDKWIVLRVYERNTSLCQKQLDLLRPLHNPVPVPVPDAIGGSHKIEGPHRV